MKSKVLKYKQNRLFLRVFEVYDIWKFVNFLKILFPKELEEHYKKEKLNLEEDKNQLQQELENLKKELEHKLNTANQEARIL